MNPFDRNRHEDIDEIDAALNVLMSDMSYQPTSENLAPILDTHRMAMSAVRSDPAAKGPAAGTWNRVLRATAQPASKGLEEMAAATWVEPKSTTHLDRPQRESGGLSRITTIAATLAVVSLLAFGGWFAAMNLPPNDNSYQQGLLAGTLSASATCDVEPMTVDEVMAIVENPYSYIVSDMYPQKSTDYSRSLEEFQDVYPVIGTSLNPAYGEMPTTSAMDGALAVIDSLMACMQDHGTVAYMLRFADPFSIQDQVRQQFPFYREEGEVRAYVEEWLLTEVPYNDATIVFDGAELAFTPIRDRADATRYLIELGLGFDQIVFIGSEVVGEDGETYMVYPVWNYALTGIEVRPGVIFMLIHSRYSGEWYVVTGNWMSPAMQKP
ncbi:MAG: hypothetical protein M9934_03615 [Thermomicrobiales bacterium]|nr:hypothetical protein [Thermomicrobiales bacterium]